MKKIKAQHLAMVNRHLQNAAARAFDAHEPELLVLIGALSRVVDYGAPYLPQLIAAHHEYVREIREREE